MTMIVSDEDDLPTSELSSVPVTDASQLAAPTPATNPDDHVLPQRPPGGPPTWGKLVVPLILAAVSLLALVVGWNHLQSRGDVLAEPGTGISAPPVPTLGPDPSSLPATGSSPRATHTPSAVATSAPTSSSRPSSPAATVVDRSVRLVVLNATARTGLAAKVAARLRALGWKVVSVGNYRRHDVGQTTVFGNGYVDATATLMRDLPAADVHLPRRVTMRPLALTVVVGPDYPR